MHADPTDRIIHSDAPDVSPVSVPRIFVVGLVLPFAHPLRLILGSILPLVLMIGLAWAPVLRIMAAWQAYFAAFMNAAPMQESGPPAVPVFPADLGLDVLRVQGFGLLALVLWLCVWQRAVARGFSEPILRWLGGSLLKLPGYILAFLIWALAPVVVLLIPTIALGWLVARILAMETVPATPLAQIEAIGAIFSDLQWWVIAIAFFVTELIALWLSARLSPLPPLVASRGWRHAFGRAWQLSRGHGFGLSVALVGYTLFGVLLLMIGLSVVSMVTAMRIDPTTDLTTAAEVAAAVDIVGAALLVLWQASLGALVVRDGMSPAEALDPAMFD